MTKCLNPVVNIDSGNGIVPVWRQDINWTNADLLTVRRIQGKLEPEYNRVFIKKMHLKMWSQLIIFLKKIFELWFFCSLQYDSPEAIMERPYFLLTIREGCFRQETHIRLPCAYQQRLHVEAEPSGHYLKAAQVVGYRDGIAVLQVNCVGQVGDTASLLCTCSDIETRDAYVIKTRKGKIFKPL